VIDTWILTWVTFLPLAGALPLLLVPERKKTLIRAWTFLVTLATFLLSLHLWFHFREGTRAFQFAQSLSWIPAAGIRYSVGIDGISLLMVLLTTFTMPLAVLGGWSAVRERVKGYHFALLLLQTAMLGVFVASDLFLFYLFWEAMLIPMYFIIGIWGGRRRIYAAVKFFIYTMAGSVLMLAAILYLVAQHHGAMGQWTFDWAALLGTPLGPRAATWAFLAFALAFAIKVPMFPLHTWLPDAHVEAPTAGSVILAAVLLKMGIYGFLRFCLPYFPDAALHFTGLFMTLAVIGIIYGALVALVQEDVKKLVAYSSVSHLGFVMLGTFALNVQGLEGGILQMVNHGLSTGALFLLVGMIYERRHSRLIDDFGGLARVMPIYTLLLMLATLSSIGLPGLNGFVGEFLILLGTFQAAPLAAILGATGIVLGAVYMLWMVQRVLFGKVEKEENRVLRDIGPREWGLLIPIVVLMFWIGLYPKPFLRKMDASVKQLIEQVKGPENTPERPRTMHSSRNHSAPGR